MIRIFGLLIGMAFFGSAYFSWEKERDARLVETLHRASLAKAQSLRSQRQLRSLPISELRPGMRVLASNPELASSNIGQSTIDKSWRLVSLRLPKPGGQIDIQLLRPIQWLLGHAVRATDDSILSMRWSDEKQTIMVERDVPFRSAPIEQFLIGHTIELELAEMGASGLAQVIDVQSCPEIEPQGNNSDRHIVTGTFRHSAANLIDLHIEDESQPIGVTDNHPFWSEDRQAFIPAGKLSPGEHLRRADGTRIQVTRINPRRGPPVEVFNLEVDAQHVYFIGEQGTLVHNHYDETVDLFRAVDNAELKDIQNVVGFRAALGGNEVKSFHESLDDVVKQARMLHSNGGSRQVSTIVKVSVPKGVADKLDLTPLDNMPTRTIQPEGFAEFNDGLLDITVFSDATPLP